MTTAEEIVMATLDHFISRDWKVLSVDFDEDDHYIVTVQNIHTLDVFDLPEIERNQSLPTWVRPVLEQVRLFFGRYPRGAQP